MTRTLPGSRRESPMGIPRRIASLLPSATEIVCALGLGDRLVLRSHECDHPEWVEGLPYATSPKYEPDGTSYQIDERVRALVQEGLSVYRVNSMALRRAMPQVIVTQEHCEVCAVPASEVEAAVAELLNPAPRIVSLSPERLNDIFDDIRRVGRELGVPDRGQVLTRELQGRMEELAEEARERAGAASARPGVLTIEWMDPLMVAGNWMPELVEMAGGRNLLGTPGEHSPFVEWSALREMDPDVMVVLPCGFGLERTRDEIETLTDRPGWSELTAVRHGRVALVDGHHYFNRPGPRIVDSLEILVEILHGNAVAGGLPRWEWLEGR